MVDGPTTPPGVNGGTQTCSYCESVIQVRPVQKCSRCKEARYCGEKCQRAHWKAGHKNTCTPPSLAMTPRGTGTTAPGSVSGGAPSRNMISISIVPKRGKHFTVDISRDATGAELAEKVATTMRADRPVGLFLEGN